MESNLVISVYSDEFRYTIVTLPEHSRAIELINLIIDKYCLQTDNYVYSLYIYEEEFYGIDDKVLGQSFSFFGNNVLQEVDYIRPLDFIGDFSFCGKKLAVQFVKESKYFFKIKEILRYCNFL